jgi:hypothetical protein
MKLKFSSWLILSAVFLLQLSMPKAAKALDLIVEHNATGTYHYETIQLALDFVTSVTGTTNSFRILVEPSTTAYTGPITLISSVPIIGLETARTIITGGGSSGALITANNVTNVTIKNLTIISAGIGIDVSNNASVNITGNIFQVGSGGTAVRVQNSPSTTIINNTFYQNGTAISNGTDNIVITNNIFSSNALAISSQASLISTASYNDYHNNTNNGILTLDANSLPNTSVSNPDPLFVDPANRDFHLKAGSPCHSYGAGTNAGNPNYPNAFDSNTFDMGAYGGPNSDTIPFPLSDLIITNSTSTTISLGWSPNNCYLVGGYKVSYGTDSGNYSTTLDAGNVTTYTITGLSGATAPTGAPVITHYDIANQTITLYWSTATVSGATGYEVRYDTVSTPTATSPSLDAKNSTSYPVSGLQNFTSYFIDVTAYAEANFFIVVKAYYTANPNTMVSSNSNEVSTSIGSKLYSATSSTAIYDFPEPIVVQPNLPNTGCFIATAAYGSYSASQVQALRKFRDQYLLTNTVGKTFVGWYYTYGPRGAQILNEHPEWKPVVRAALLPAVGVAMFLTQTSSLTKAMVLIIGLSLVLLLVRNKLTPSGGVQ